MALSKPKKYLGQHFLEDPDTAQKFVGALSPTSRHQPIIEIGPGTGALTSLLVQRQVQPLYLVEIDPMLVAYLKRTYPSLAPNILEADFLSLAIDALWTGPIVIIGNFPYNIASQIFFKVLTHRHQVQEVVAMVQKEVAVRITAQPGTKDYGIPSVLLQAFYTVEYLFPVSPHLSNPPPKVHSAVVRLRQRPEGRLDCDEALFLRIVKAAFQQRRKTLRNALKPLQLPEALIPSTLLKQRAEQLTVEDFAALTRFIE